MRDALRELGAFRPDPVGVGLQLAGHVVTSVIGTGLFFVAPSTPWAVLGAALSILGGMGVATNSHTASHGAAHRSRRVNQALCLFGYSLWVGLSADYWHWSHVQRHHRAPNHRTIDPDCQLEPMFSVLEPVVRDAGPVRRFYYRYLQGFVLWGVAAFMGLNMWRQGLMRVAHQLFTAPRRVFPWLDALALVAHFGLWLVLPAVFFGLEAALLHYLVRALGLGYALFLVIGPAHLNPHARLTDARADQSDRIARQATTTIDYKVGPIGRWLCSGLELHVEHHLYPAIPHTRLYAAAPVIREALAQRGMPVYEVGWGRALVEMTRTFFRPKPLSTAPLQGRAPPSGSRDRSGISRRRAPS